jgi:hypothetical protein
MLKGSKYWAPARELLSIVSVVIIGLARAVLVDLGKSVANAELLLLRVATSKSRTLRLASYTDSVAPMRGKPVRS